MTKSKSEHVTSTTKAELSSDDSSSSSESEDEKVEEDHSERNLRKLPTLHV